MNGYAMLNEAARLIGLDSADEKLKIIGLTLLNSALVDMGIKGCQPCPFAFVFVRIKKPRR